MGVVAGTEVEVSPGTPKPCGSAKKINTKALSSDSKIGLTLSWPRDSKTPCLRNIPFIIGSLI